jgi:hypothetical protein
MTTTLTAPGPDLTPELAEQLLRAAKSGVFKETAAEAVGIAPDLLDQWLRMGLSPGAVEPYRTFARAYRAQEQGVQLEAIDAWRAASQHDWKAAQAWLAARYPDQWGPKATRNKQSSDLQPTEADVAAEEAMVEGLLDNPPPALVRLLAKRGIVLDSVQDPAKPKG